MFVVADMGVALPGAEEWAPGGGCAVLQHKRRMKLGPCPRRVKAAVTGVGSPMLCDSWCYLAAVTMGELAKGRVP